MRKVKRSIEVRRSRNSASNDRSRDLFFSDLYRGRILNVTLVEQFTMKINSVTKRASLCFDLPESKISDQRIFRLEFVISTA